MPVPPALAIGFRTGAAWAVGADFRPVETDPLAPVELYAAWRSDNDNPALAAFLDLLRPEPDAPMDMDALAASNDDSLY